MDRQAFSTAADETIERLDFDQARNRIPLVDAATGEVSYGLDAILGVVGHELALLRPVLARPVVRRPLDAIYWLITYNRRHIMAAPPPASGADCAPDRNPRAIAAYLGLTGLAAAAATALTRSPATGAAAGAAIGARKVWLRRWLLGSRRPVADNQRHTSPRPHRR